MSSESRVYIKYKFPVGRCLFRGDGGRRLRRSVIRGRGLLRVRRFRVFFSGNFFVGLGEKVISMGFCSQRFRSRVSGFILLRYGVSRRGGGYVFSFVSGGGTFFDNMVTARVSPSKVTKFGGFERVVYGRGLCTGEGCGSRISEPLDSIGSVPVRRGFLGHKGPFAPSCDAGPDGRLRTCVSSFGEGCVSLGRGSVIGESGPVRGGRVGRGRPFRKVCECVLKRGERVCYPMYEDRGYRCFASRGFVPKRAGASCGTGLGPFGPFAFTGGGREIVGRDGAMLRGGVVYSSYKGVFS